MKSKFLLLFVLSFILAQTSYAQTSCTDLNGYVNHKNTNGTGYYTLNAGYEEKAAQTYYYSGPGKVGSVRIYGNNPVGVEGGVALRVSIYNVDNTGRPTTLIGYTNTAWWWYNNATGYLDVNLPNGGIAVNANFAVEVELRNAFPWGSSFKLQYTGDGEGLGQDLASLAGTSTGGNWSSAEHAFNKDGDFYLIPRMTNYITSDFGASATCINTGALVSFTNTSKETKDSMFNLIGSSMTSSNYYEWNFGDGSAVSNAVNPTHTFATAGVYTVSLKTTLVGWNNTCYDIKTMRVSVGLSTSVSSIVNVTCNGLANGSAIATGTGGAGNYTYSLNDGSYVSTASFTGLSAGNYTMHVGDDLGCTATTSFTISEPAAITFSTASTTNASCGNADGGILVIAEGGAGSLQYKLNEGSYQSTGAFSNISAGSYSITVKDANGCMLSEPVAVNDAGGPSLTLYSATNVSCHNGTDGTILVLGSGGSGALSYSNNGGSTFQSTGSFLGLPGGNYVVMVKDAVGCSQYVEVTIAQPGALSLRTSTTPASCFGGENGTVSVTSASGGTGVFTYSIDGTNYQSYPNFSGLGYGDYTVYIKDAAGCTLSAIASVKQPAAITASVTATNATCSSEANGALNIVASGGTPEYMFSIGGETVQPTGNFENLLAGQYNITVTDANYCTMATSATITQPSIVSATINTTTSTCGNSNGGLLAVASGGSGSGYSYTLSNSSTNSTGSFSGLASGTYYIMVSDGNACVNIFPATIADANGPVISSSNHTNISCNQGNDGTIVINNVTGGTGNLVYSINGTNWQLSSQFRFLTAGDYVVTVKDANGCTGTIYDTLTQPNAFTMSTATTNLACYDDNSGKVVVTASGGAGVFAYSIDGGITYQASNVFTGLSAGSNFVFVRDAASCIGTTVYVLTQPAKLALAGQVLNVTCNGAENGAIVLKGTGGTGSYTYSLNSGGFFGSSIFLHLNGGNYTAIIKDANGCITSIPLWVYEPLALTTVPTVSEVSCAGGDNGIIAMDVIGGTSPYSYVWADNITSQDRFNLIAGNYTVTVRDGNGCADTTTVTISQPQNPLVVNGVVVNASSSGNPDGSVNLTITGGNAPYTYLWSNNATTQDISNLAGGNYSVNVKDANGCIVTGIFYVAGPTGINQIEADNNSVIIYPNPSSGNSTIEAGGYSITRIKVISVEGRVIFESEPNNVKAAIQCNDFATGVYVVQVQANNNWMTKKLVVTR